MLIDTILLTIAILLLCSIFASKVSARLSVPALLLFLVIGMLAGSEGIGGIYFDDAEIAQATGVIALIFILFSGSLDTPIAEVRRVVGRGVILSTVGVLITALVVALFTMPLLNLSPALALMLGAIVSATDAAAVFSIFTTQRISLKGNTIPLLELESGSNDPMAIFLTIGAIQLVIHPATSALEILAIFLQQMLIGGLLGYVFGVVAVRTINHIRLESVGLYPILTVAFVLLTYSVTAKLGGSGFLAVYLAGLVLSSKNLIHKRSLSQFHDSLAWLMQIIMFLVLGLLVFPSELPGIALVGVIISLVLIFIARPLGVFVSLIASEFTLRDKLMISWVGLRGATPIVLATFPLLAGVEQADTIFNVVFFVVLGSVMLQGTTIIQVARLLGVSTPYTAKPEWVFELKGGARLKSELIELPVPPDAPIIGQQVVEIGFPAESLIVLIMRGQEIILPNGGTIIEAGDLLLLFAEGQALKTIRALMQPPAPVITS